MLKTHRRLSGIARVAVAVGIAGRTICPGVTSSFAAHVPAKTVYVVRHGTAVHNVRYKQKNIVFKHLIDQRSKSEADRENRWLFPEIEEWAYMTNETIDTSLVHAGIAEAQLLGSAWAQNSTFLHNRGGKTQKRVPLVMLDIDLIVTSPLTRTLQTMSHIFFRPELTGTGVRNFVPRWQRLEDEHCQPGVQSNGDARPGPSILALDVVREWSQGRHTPNRRKTKSELALEYPHVDFSFLDSETDLLWQEYWPGTDDGLEPRSHLESRVARFKEWLVARPERNIVVVSHGTFLGNLLFGSFIEDTVELAHCQVYMIDL